MKRGRARISGVNDDEINNDDIDTGVDEDVPPPQLTSDGKEKEASHKSGKEAVAVGTTPHHRRVLGRSTGQPAVPASALPPPAAPSPPPPPPPPPLGATQLAIALQDAVSNPVMVGRILRQFVQQVRHERRIALRGTKKVLQNKDNNDSDEEEDDGSDDDDSVESDYYDLGSDSDSDDSDGNENSTNLPEDSHNGKPSSPKRQRRNDPIHNEDKDEEEWKRDANRYGVPFVGTSVGRMERHPVIPGVWPTGLLDAYLRKSPAATELVTLPCWYGATIAMAAANNPHSGTTSHSSTTTATASLRKLTPSQRWTLARAQLQAFAELVTAGVNVNARFATEDSQLSPSPSPAIRFLPGLIERHLESIVTAVQGCARQLQSRRPKAKPKPTVVDSTGASAAADPTSAVISLSPAARLLPDLLRLWLHLSRASVPPSAVEHAGRVGGGGVAGRGPVQMPLLLRDLPNVRLPWRLLLRIAMPDGNDSDGGHFPPSVVRDRAAIMEARRLLVDLAHSWLQSRHPPVLAWLVTPGSSSGQPRREQESRPIAASSSSSSSPGLLYEIFREGVALDVNGNTAASDDTAEHVVCQSLARLLGSLHRLILLPRGKPAIRFAAEALSSRECGAHLVQWARLAPSATTFDHRAILQRQDGGEDDEVGLQSSRLQAQRRLGTVARRFLFCLMADPAHSPFLALKTVAEAPLVRLMQLLLPAPGISIQKFLVHCLEVTPQLSSPLFRSLPVPDPASHTIPWAKTMRFWVRVLRSWQPARGGDRPATSPPWPALLKKQQVTQALQGSNPLVVTVTLQALALYLRKQAVAGTPEEGDMNLEAVHAEMKNLPEIAVLTRLLNGTSSNVVAGSVCEVLLRWIQCKTAPRPSSIDWVAQFAPASAFDDTPLWLQRKRLVCLEQVLQADTYAAARSSPDVLISIAIKTADPEVHKQARNIAVTLFPSFTTSSTVHPETDLAFEYKCWVDGITRETLDEFCAMIRQSMQDPLGSLLAVSKAWQRWSVPSVPTPDSVSSIMALALGSLATMTTRLAQLTCQIAARCMLYQLDPLPLAATVLAALNEFPDGSLSTMQRQLAQYASCLVVFDPQAARERVMTLKSMIQTLFHRDSTVNRVACGHWKAKEASDCTGRVESLVAVFRYLSHVVIVSGGTEQRTLARRLCRSVLPSVLKIQAEAVWPVLKRISRVSRDPPVDATDLLVRSSGSVFASSDEQFWAIRTDPESLTLETLRAHASKVEVSYCAILASFVPRRFLSRWAANIIDSVSRSGATRHLGVGCIFIHRAIEEKLHLLNDSGDLAMSAFDCWSTDQESKSSAAFLLGLERLLCSFLKFETPSTVSKPLEEKFLGLSATVVVDRCVESKKRRDDASRHCLLAALVEADQATYAPAVLNRIVSDSHSEKSGILTSGVFDNAIRFSIRSSESVASCPTAPFIVARHYLARLSSIPPADLDALLVGLEESAALVSRNQIEYTSLTRQIMEKLIVILTNKDPASRKKVVDLDQLTPLSQSVILRLVYSLTSQQSPGLEIDVRENAVSASVFRLLMILPISIRSRNAVLTEQLDLLGQFLDSPCLSPGNVDWVSVVAAAIRACLKHGLQLNAEGRGYRTEERLLEMTQRLVDSFSNDAYRCHLLPEGVFVMLTSHSKFHALVATEDNDEAVGVKSALLTLLARCASLVTSKLVFDNATITSLLQGFNASTSPCDNEIRRLLQMYSDIESENSIAISFDRMRWRGVAEIVDGAGLNWVADAIEMKRVYATLSAFPGTDPLRLDVPSGQSRDPLMSDFKDLSVPGYSPGFLLPMILAALESADAISLTSPAFQESSVSTNGVQLAQRLCDRGALALTLACLCSECSSLRLIAVAILRSVALILDSEVARKHQAWKERPQLSMILRSVQKALAIRRIEADEQEQGLVPRLPGVSALFLARACLVVTRPNDDMYPAINQYFLNSLTDHGAYQDMFRLPGFMSLYHSTVEDPDLARKHRMWALRIVKDGFLDETCFKPLFSCHAPELILTSFDNFRHRSGTTAGEEETALLLSSLLKVLQFGGPKMSAAVHGRLGLPYWMHSVLVGRPILEMLPTLDSLILFLRISSSVITNARTLMEDEELHEWCARCSNSLAKLLLNSVKANGAWASERNKRNFGAHATDLLSNLATVLERAQGENRIDGLDLQSANELIEVTPATNQRCLTVVLCSMPLAPESDAAIATTFCRGLLVTLGTLDGDDLNLRVLKCVSRISDSRRNVNLGPALFDTLVSLRHRLHRHPDTKRELRRLLGSDQ